MADIWLKGEEAGERKAFLTLIMLVFTLLLGSTGLKGDPIYYISFLAASLTYYLLLDRERIQSSIMVVLALFVSFTFTAYLYTLYSASELASIVDFKPLLHAIIFTIVSVGLLPENLVSEVKKFAPGIE